MLALFFAANQSRINLEGIAPIMYAIDDLRRLLQICCFNLFSCLQFSSLIVYYHHCSRTEYLLSRNTFTLVVISIINNGNVVFD